MKAEKKLNKTENKNRLRGRRKTISRMPQNQATKTGFSVSQHGANYTGFHVMPK